MFRNISRETFKWAVVVAQLVEQSLPTPEIRGSNPDIGKILSSNCKIEKIEIKKRNRPQTRAYWKDIERIGDREQKQRTNSTERIK